MVIPPARPQAPPRPRRCPSSSCDPRHAKGGEFNSAAAPPLPGMGLNGGRCPASSPSGHARAARGSPGRSSPPSPWRACWPPTTWPNPPATATCCASRPPPSRRTRRSASASSRSIALLRATSGLFAAAEVDRRLFSAYVQRLELERRYPGLQGIGFSRRLRAGEREALPERMRAQGFAGFRHWPEHAGEEQHAVLYLEPYDERNLAALGFDMSTDPVRAQAMDRARDTGLAEGSGKVELVQDLDPEDRQAGFLVFVPVYAGGRVPETVAERRAALEGFVYAPFRAGDLMWGIFGGETPRHIQVEVFDGAQAREEGLLYRSAPPPAEAVDAARTPIALREFASHTTLDMAGRVWTLQFRSGPGFPRDNAWRFVPLVLLGGLSPRSSSSRSPARRSAPARRRRPSPGQRPAVPPGGGGARGGRGGQPRQGRVPGHAVPRAAHAADRDPRLDADPAQGGGGRADRGRAGSRSSSATCRRRRGSSRTCSTCRGSSPARCSSTVRPGRAGGGDRGRHRVGAAGGGRAQGHRPRRPWLDGPAVDRRRPRAPAAGAVEPAQQRHQVHARRRPHRGAPAPGDGAGRRRGHRHAARASTPSSCPTSSTASGRPTAAAPAPTAGSASASPSSATSSSCTAAPCEARSRGAGTGSTFAIELPVAGPAVVEDEPRRPCPRPR